jgi:hypothetical protein
MDNLLAPFSFLRLRHAELRTYVIYSMLAALLWSVADVLHMIVADRTVNFFSEKGVLESLVALLSVMVGIYFGLAGVFIASSNPWLDSAMPNGVLSPDSKTPMTRKAFFVSLLVYCSASSSALVFLGALLPPVARPLVDLSMGFATSEGFAYAGELRAILSILCSTGVVFAYAHLFLSSLLSLRFLSKAGGA